MKSTRSSARSRASGKRTESVTITEPLKALVRGLSRSNGFTLFFAVCNWPAERDRYISMLGEALRDNPVHLIALTEGATDLLAEIREKIPDPKGPVMVIGLESAIPSIQPRHDILTVLNLQRPRWRKELSVPVVFWIPEYVLGFIEREAPDFFDWRSDTILFPDIESSEIDAIRQLTWSPVIEGNLRIEQRLDLIKELRARLEGPVLSETYDSVIRARWLTELARNLTFIGDENEALTLFRKAVSIFNEHKYYLESAGVSADIAHILYNKGEVDEALGLFEASLKMSIKQNNPRTQALILMDIARIKYDKGDIKGSLVLQKKAKNIFNKIGDRRSCALVLSDIARNLHCVGNIDKALSMHKEAADILEELGDKRSYAVTLSNVAQILYEKGNLDEALLLYKKQLSFFEEKGDAKSRGIVLASIANIEREKGNIEEALRLHRENLAYFEKTGDVNGIAHSLASIGQIEMQKGQFQAAIEHLSKSYEINADLSNLHGISFIGLDYGFLLANRGDKINGLAVLERSRDGFLKLGRKDLADEAQHLIDTYSPSPHASPQKKTAAP